VTARILESLRGTLVVSCQAYEGEPMRDTRTMTQVALAAEIGGASAIRAQGLDDLAAMHAVLGVPLIGLVKEGTDPVFITPTKRSALAIAATGAAIVALDATLRTRPGGESLVDIVAAVHAAGALVLGDIGGSADAAYAIDCGVDAVATTLAGYTGERPAAGPDLALVAELAGLPVPVFAEGRIATPEQARAALDAGAHAVIVGTAITHPTSLTRRFAAALR
jgi:N-acylglucosamine-6-phosphate 2-epimerase